MLSAKNIMVFGAVIVIAVILQVILILGGEEDNPAEAAVDFTKAYFMLNGPAMSQMLCSELAGDTETNIVNEYLNQVAARARSMGFSQSYMQDQLTDIHTKVEMTDKNTARVEITGERLRSINPLYALIGRLFSLIEPHKFDVTLKLVKEDDKWKVCSKPLLLSPI